MQFSNLTGLISLCEVINSTKIDTIMNILGQDIIALEEVQAAFEFVILLLSFFAYPKL